MNFRTLVVSHTQAAKLIQPGERPLYDPAKLTEATPCLVRQTASTGTM